MGVSYDLYTGAFQHDPASVSERIDQVAIDGTTESIYSRTDEVITVTTTTIKLADLLALGWPEFFASVADGSPFDLDVDGSQGSPVNPQTVILVGSPSRQRATWDSVRYSFTVRVLP